mgnify:FL=1
MAKPKSPGGPKQKLSRAAALRKAIRDKAFAMTDERRNKKADSQRRRKEAGASAKGKDYDHKSGTFKSIAANRGNDGAGTKREGRRNYRVAKSEGRARQA